MKTPLKPIEWVLLVLALAAVAWLLYSNVATWRDWQEQASLQRAGVTATAEVTRAERRIQGRHSVYHVAYSYAAGARTYQRDEPVDPGTFADAERRRSVEVRYLPDRPDVAGIVGNDSTRVDVWSVLIFDALFVGLVVVFLLCRNR